MQTFKERFIERKKTFKENGQRISIGISIQKRDKGSKHEPHRCVCV